MFFIAEVQIKSTESAWGIHTASLISSPISEVFAKVLKHFVMNVRMVPEGGGREREKVNQRAALKILFKPQKIFNILLNK